MSINDMKHSKIEITEEEIELARQNAEYLARKKNEVPLRQPRGEELTRKRRPPIFCCGFVLIITLLAMMLIYYFASSIGSDVINEYLDKKNFFQTNLPQGKEELKKSIEHGEDLFNNTKDNVDEAKQTYDEAKEIYDSGKEIYNTINN